MTDYYTNTEGIKGRIKERYADFIVEEFTETHQCKVEHFLDKSVETSMPEKTGKHLILEMEKFNADQQFAVKQIARFLQVSKQRIGFAGLKDKRAITSQRISVFEPEMERITAFKSRSIFLKPLAWSNDKIELGHLKGNAFTITIRELEKTKEALTAIITAFGEQAAQGIPNYFGEQRFGGIRQITHKVGKLFIQGKIKEGVLLYLTATNESEDQEVQDIRNELLETLDYQKAVKAFPAPYRYEKAILHYLCKYPNDFANAFRELPRNMWYLFTHAYQSYLFNEAIKERVKQGLGLQPIANDVLEDEVPTGQLLGYESVFTDSVQSDIEKTILEKEGLTLDRFKVKAFPEISTRGHRKKIMCIPEQFTLQSISNDECNEGKRKAVLSFSLPKGTYATTVLAELMK